MKLTILALAIFLTGFLLGFNLRVADMLIKAYSSIPEIQELQVYQSLIKYEE